MPTELLRISTDDKFSSSLSYIAKRFAAFEKGGAVAVKLDSDSTRPCVSVALNDCFSDKLKRNDQITIALVRKVATTAIDAVAEVVVTDCKSHYIQSRLKLPIEDDVNRHAFIKALSAFDSFTDKTIAKSLIKLTPDFLLDSFYEFMTDDLKNRWQEVCTLANENICYLVCGKTFSELLRFLISNIETLSDEAHIFMNTHKKKIEVLGSNMKPLNVYINESLPPDVQVVTKLIAVNPKKIYVHQENAIFDKSLVSNIKNLFGSCVQIVKTN